MRAPVSVRDRCKLVVDRATHPNTPLVEVRQCLRMLARLEAQYSGLLDAGALARIETAEVRVGTTDLMHAVHTQLLHDYKVSAYDAYRSTDRPWVMDSHEQLVCSDEADRLERAILEAMERRRVTKRAVRLNAHAHLIARSRYDTFLLFTHKYATALNEWATTPARRRANALKREDLRRMLLDQQGRLSELDAHGEHARGEEKRMLVELRILREESSAWQQVCKQFDAHLSQRLAFERLRQMEPGVSMLPWE